MSSVAKPVRACVVGIGGYGRIHLEALLALEAAGLARTAAVVENDHVRCAEQLAALRGVGVQCYETLSEALDARGFDFVTLATPLHLHRPMTVAALDAGFPVLCEKSAAPTVQDVRAMADAQERTGLPLDIAYPRQNGTGTVALQRALIDGTIGQVTHVVVRGGWLREDRYYRRAAWAGRLKVAGDWTLDGPINNLLAHYLYAGLFFASRERGRIVSPAHVRSELYRARPGIEGEDTASLEIACENGVRVYFYATLASPDTTYADVRIDVHGENGVLTWFGSEQGMAIRGRRSDGTAIEVPHDGVPGTTARSIENFARHLLGERTGLYSPISESIKFARASNGAFDSSRRIHPVPAGHVREHGDGEDRSYELRGIVAAMRDAGERPGLFSDVGLPWAVKTEPVDVTGYGRFPLAFECG